MSTHLPLHEAFLNQKITVLKPRIAHCLPLTASVWDAVKLFASAKVGSILVMDDNDNMKGIFTERDLITKYIPSRTLRTIRLPDVMSTPVEHVRSSTSIARLIHIFASQGIRHVAVTDRRSSPPLILSARDLLDHIYRSITGDMTPVKAGEIADQSDVAKFFNLPVSAASNHKPVCLQETTSVTQAVLEMKSAEIGICTINNHQEFPIGIFGERDLNSRVFAAGLDLDKTTLLEVMTKDPVTLYQHSPLSKALNLMSVNGFRHIPLLSAENRLTSVVSLMDIVRTLGKSA